MKKISSFSCFILLIVVSVTFSCKQDLIENISINKQMSPESTYIDGVKNVNGVLCFETTEHFEKVTRSLYSLSIKEKLYYSTRLLGKEAFALNCDMFYDSINWQELNKEGFAMLLKEHSNFLCVERDDKNGVSVLPALYNVPERYFLNLDRLYVIGDIMYKCFSDTLTVATLNKEDNVSLLKKIESNDIQQILNNEKFIVINNSEDVVNDNVNIGSYSNPRGMKKDDFTQYSSDKKYRTRVIVKSNVKSEVIFGDGRLGTAGYRGELKITVINEKKGKAFWFTKWYNTEYDTHGSICVNTNGCIYDIHSNKCISWYSKPEWKLDIDEGVKDYTWDYTVFKQAKPMVAAKKPWLRISGITINLRVPSIGVIMNR